MSFRSLKKKRILQDGMKLEDNMEDPVPLHVKKRLDSLFGQIETEFAEVYQENVLLKARLGQLENQSGSNFPMRDGVDMDGAWNNLPRNASQFSRKVMTKYKEHTNKIVSSFKAPHVSLGVQLIHRYSGHRDGIWDVTYCPGLQGRPIIGTASNDKAARVWAADGKHCLLKYFGHTGSVNSIRFHPSLPLVLTSSGDRTAHIWCCDVPESDVIFPDETSHNSEDELSEEEGDKDGNRAGPIVVRTPHHTLGDHNNAVMAAEWMSGGSQAVTASWDRTAKVWDVETCTVLQTLSGHDLEITNTTAHPSQHLLATTSKDTTFRVWDFRSSIHSVNVYQGHTAAVTCAIFTSHQDSIVSGSDDNTVKVWDLRNMRQALVTIQSDAAVNRISISNSPHHTLAVPFDNRHVRLYDLQGTYLGRLPRRSQAGHQRMVCCATWCSDNNPANLYTCGFDNRTISWKITFDKER